MRILLSLCALAFLSTCALAQPGVSDSTLDLDAGIKALNNEYFDKLKRLQAAQIESLEARRKEATTRDQLDEAIRLRDAIEKIKTEMGTPILPDDNNRIFREKARLEGVLARSKWSCANTPNLLRMVGAFLVFHENGTIVSSSNEQAKLPHHRWATLDGRTIVGMFGDYMIVFRLNEKGDALDVYEIGGTSDTKSKRHSYVVQSPPISKSIRDGK